MQTIGERLRLERERLGLSQTACGELGGVKKLAQINYEKGVSFPTATYLAAMATAGADVLYIVTGARGGILMTPEESALLDNFRHSPPAARQALKTTSDLFAKHDCPGATAESA
jgi:transcriptional regulator with XRE-family HTH domain